MDLKYFIILICFCFSAFTLPSARSQVDYPYAPSANKKPEIEKADHIDTLTLLYDTELNADIKNNIDLYLQALTLPAVSRLEQHQNEMIKEAHNALKALGYYSANVVINLNQSGSELIASLQVLLGPPIIITGFNFELLGAGTNDRAFMALKDRLSLALGDQFHHGVYESIKSEFNALALQRGYFEASWLKHEVMIDVTAATATINMQFDLKQRYHFGAVHISPAQTPAFDIIQSMAPFKYGQPYSARLVADYSVDLSSSSYFKSVIIQPKIQQSEDHIVPMEVKVLPKSADLFKVGGGFSTDVKVRGQFYWTRPWVNRWGHSITTGFEASSIQQVYSFSYQIPIKDPVSDYLGITAGVVRKVNNDTDSRVISIQGQRFQKFSSDWRRSLFVRWQREDFRQSSQQNISNLIIPGVSYSYSYALGGLDPYKGYQQLLSLEFSDPSWGSDERLVKARTYTKLIRQYRSTHRLTSRLDLGAIAVDAIDSVPSSMRFFTGGDQSIRGYKYESVAPINELGELIGGLYLVVGSIEYSYPVLDKWRLLLFVDSGTATNDFSEKISTGAGLGLRWLTPIGPVKFDFGFPLTEDEPLKEWRFHFTVGPEL